MSASTTTHASQTPARRVLRDIVRKAFSFPACLGALLVAGAFLALMGGLATVSSDPMSVSKFWLQGDTWWHLTIGRQILLTHSWPRVDIYSFTMHGKPWVAYEWLGEVILAAAWMIGHLRGLMILLTALAGAVTLLIFYYSYLRTRDAMAAFLACAALLPLISLSFPLRPQLLGYAFLVITLIALEKFRQGHPKALWVLPAVFLLWVNTHGTFALGFAALAIYFASGFVAFRIRGLYAERWMPGQRRQLGLTILLCAFASVLTPYGARLVLYYVEMSCLKPINLEIVTEWLPFPLFSPTGVLFIASLLVFCAALLTRRLPCRLADFVLLTLAAAETLLHSRFILFFVPVFAPLLAQLLSRWLPKHQQHSERPLANAFLMALVVIALVGLFPSQSRLQQIVKRTNPVDAASFIKSHPGLGRMFTYYDWGSYLIFDLGTAHQGFMDGRLDLYEGSGVFKDYLTVYWEENGMWPVLSKYQIHSCLAPRHSKLARLLADSPHWEEVYHDPTSLIFIKTGKIAAAGPVSDAQTNHLPSSRSVFHLWPGLSRARQSFRPSQAHPAPMYSGSHAGYPAKAKSGICRDLFLRHLNHTGETRLSHLAPYTPQQHTIPLVLRQLQNSRVDFIAFSSFAYLFNNTDVIQTQTMIESQAIDRIDTTVHLTGQ